MTDAVPLGARSRTGSSGAWHFAVDTPECRQAWLWIAAVLSLVYSLLFLIPRASAKWRNFAHDDAVLAAAYGVSMAAHACIFAGLKSGLGKAPGLVDNYTYAQIAKLVFASRILYFVVLGLARVSAVLFIRQLFTKHLRPQWISCNVMLALVGCWSVLAICLASAGCSATDALESRFYLNSTTRWRLIGATEMALEALLIILPIYHLARISLGIEQRLVVIAVFSFRLTMMPLCVWFIHSLMIFSQDGIDNIGLVSNLISQEVLICWSLIVATVPCLRKFVARFNTGGMRLSCDPTIGGCGLLPSPEVTSVGKDYSPMCTLTKTQTMMSVPVRPSQALVRKASSLRYLGLNTFSDKREAERLFNCRPDLDTNTYHATILAIKSAATETISEIGVEGLGGITKRIEWDVERR